MRLRPINRKYGINFYTPRKWALKIDEARRENQRIKVMYKIIEKLKMFTQELEKEGKGSGKKISIDKAIPVMLAVEKRKKDRRFK